MITIIQIFILLFVLLLGAIIGFSFWLTRRRQVFKPRSPAEYNLPFEDAEFTTEDGLRLRGWWIPAGTDRTLILLHGFAGSLDPDVIYTPALHAAGFNILQFDFRGHGRSDKGICTFGYLERRDVRAALNFASRKGGCHFGVVGFSMGGMVAVLSAAECPQIKAIVHDGGPARLSSAIAGRGIEHGVPRWLSNGVARLTVAVTSLRVGINLFRYEPIRWAKHIAPRPILFIHGRQDPYTTPQEFEGYVKAAGTNASAWIVEQAGHRNVDAFHPQEYRQRVVDFFIRAFDDAERKTR